MTDDLLRALGRRQRQGPIGSATLEPESPVKSQNNQAFDFEQEVLRPFDEAEREALLDAVFAKVDQASVPAAVEGAAAEAIPAPIDLAARRGTRTRAVVGALTAVAAALLLFFVLRGGGEPGAPMIASLPSYAVTQLRGGAATVRDRPDAPPSSIVLSPDATIDWVLTPERPVRERLTLVIVATPSEGASRLFVPAGTTFSEEGVVFVRGQAEALLGLPPGEWKLELVVAPAQQAPTTLAEARAERFPRTTISATISAP